MNLAQILLTFAATSLLAMTACEKRTVVVVEKPPGEPIAQTKTLETSGLKASIDAYEQAPTAERAADVRKAFAELDGEIAELQGGSEQAEAAQKLANLSAYRAAEAKRFEQAGGSRPTGIVVDPRPGVEKVEDAARKTGEALKDAAKETRDAIKDAVR
jgi:hypothetical protein